MQSDVLSLAEKIVKSLEPYGRDRSIDALDVARILMRKPSRVETSKQRGSWALPTRPTWEQRRNNSCS